MASPLKIRPLQHKDFPAWLPLWDGNNHGQRDQAVTTETWARLMDETAPIHGLCAEKDGQLCGLVHYVLHLTTGAIAPVCYMQDVYVDPAQRQQGIGRKLVKAVAKQGAKDQWARIYWLAQNGNKEAQGLYKDIGVQLDFSLHVLPIGQ